MVADRISEPGVSAFGTRTDTYYYKVTSKSPPHPSPLPHLRPPMLHHDTTRIQGDSALSPQPGPVSLSLLSPSARLPVTQPFSRIRSRTSRTTSLLRASRIPLVMLAGWLSPAIFPPMSHCVLPGHVRSSVIACPGRTRYIFRHPISVALLNPPQPSQCQVIHPLDP